MNDAAQPHITQALAFVVAVLLGVIATGLTIDALGAAAPIIGLVVAYVTARAVVTTAQP